MGRKKKSGTQASRSGNGANLGFEEKLWAAADKMRAMWKSGISSSFLLEKMN